jgi:hypothetical protein
LPERRPAEERDAFYGILRAHSGLDFGSTPNDEEGLFMRKIFAHSTMLALLAALVVPSIGCSRDQAGDAGDAMDDAAYEAGQAMEDAAEKVGEAMEEAGDAMDAMAEEAGEAMEEAGETMMEEGEEMMEEGEAMVEEADAAVEEMMEEDEDDNGGEH